MADSRLVENDKCLQWLQDWQSEVKGRKDLKAAERNKLFLSDKTMNDVTSCILGFKALCSFSFQAHPGCNVSAYRVNSDLVENIFCQQRGRNGQNDNPTYAQYGPSINSILLGQSTTTKKSNTGKVDRYAFYKPQKLPVKRKDTKKEPAADNIRTDSDVPTNNADKLCNDNALCASEISTESGPCLTEFLFPASISQSTLGGRNGSNACTLIAIYVCNHFVKLGLPTISSDILPTEWSSMLVNCISAGNSLYTLNQCGNVLLDVGDAYNKFSDELQLESYDENVCNCTNEDMSPVIGMLSRCASEQESKGCLLITQGYSVAVLSSDTGELVLVDSHSHVPFGALICRSANDASALVKWYQKSFQKCYGKPFGNICTVTYLTFS